VAQVWIFRPGKLWKPELERTKSGGLGLIVSPISKSRCGPPALSQSARKDGARILDGWIKGGLPAHTDSWFWIWKIAAGIVDIEARVLDNRSFFRYTVGESQVILGILLKRVADDARKFE
jgi:hypothetical protein